jgi:uncharacterized protein YhfF
MDPLPPLQLVLDELARRAVVLPPGPVALDAYGDSPELARELIALILAGRKRAGTGLLWSYEAEGEPLPEVGTIEIVVDDQGEPVVVTRLTSVEVVPFGEVTAAYAAMEGEGDGSLSYWREGHWAYFSRECARIGRVPSEEMPVVCGVFEVLQVVPSAEETDRG